MLSNIWMWKDYILNLFKWNGSDKRSNAEKQICWSKQICFCIGFIFMGSIKSVQMLFRISQLRIWSVFFQYFEQLCRPSVIPTRCVPAECYVPTEELWQRWERSSRGGNTHNLDHHLFSHNPEMYMQLSLAGHRTTNHQCFFDDIQ